MYTYYIHIHVQCIYYIFIYMSTVDVDHTHIRLKYRCPCYNASEYQVDGTMFSTVHIHIPQWHIGGCCFVQLVTCKALIMIDFLLWHDEMAKMTRRKTLAQKNNAFVCCFFYFLPVRLILLSDNIILLVKCASWTATLCTQQQFHFKY